MLAIIGGSGLTQLVEPRRDRAEGGAHPVRRAVGRAHVRPAARPGNRVPRAPRLRPHDPAARGELPRQHLGAAGRRRRPRSSRWPRSAGSAPTSGRATLVVPHQIIDYTWGRRSTFFEGGDVPVTHIDFTAPYAERLRQKLLAAARGVRRDGRRRRGLRRDPGPAARDRPPRSTGWSATAPRSSA